MKIKTKVGLLILVLGSLVLATTLNFDPLPVRAIQLPESVQMKYLQGDKSTPMEKRSQDRLYEKWVVPRDITVIGVEIGVEIKFYKGERLREGLALSESCRAAAYLSTGSPRDYDKRFAVVHASAWYFPNADIGYGDLINRAVIMFPAGYGIRLPAGDTIYLRATTDNNQSYIQRYGDTHTYARAIIYYVEN